MLLLGDDDEGSEELSNSSLAAVWPSFGGVGFGKKNLRILVAQVEILYIITVCKLLIHLMFGLLWWSSSSSSPPT